MLIAYAVYDVKAASYGMPMFLHTKGLAIRGFSDACADGRSMLCQHPEDYQLFEIGLYEPNTGKLTSLPEPSLICSASQVVAQLQLARQPRKVNEGDGLGKEDA